MPPAQQAQSPTPSNGNPEGSDLQSIANQVEGLMSDDGDITDGRISRAHPDYDGDAPHDQQRPARDDKGKFAKKQPAATPDDDQTDQEAETDQLADGDVENEDTEQQPGDTDEQLADSADEKPENEETETDDGEQINTLAQFADALEMTVDELLESVTDTFGAAGEEVTVTLNELRSGYQKDADYRRQTQQLADNRQRAELDYTQRMQQFDEQNQFLATHLNATEEMFMQQLNDPALVQLRQSDPAEWTARNNELSQQIAHVRGQRDQAMQRYAQFKSQQLQELKAREMQAIQQVIPDFKTDVHGEQARQVMSSIGYQPDEIKNIFDHRLVQAALELGNLRTEVETLRAEKAQAKESVKRVTKQVPKLQKPGKSRPQGRVTRSNLQNLAARAKKSGSLDDAAAVISELGLAD